MKSKPVSEVVAAALYDFAAFLSVGPVIQVGETADTSVVHERLQEFMAARNLEVDEGVEIPINDWQELVD